MAVYKRIKRAQDGKDMYLNVTESKEVQADQLPVAVREELDLADYETEIDEETVTKGAGDGVVGKDGEEKAGDDTGKSSDDEKAGKSDKPATPQASQGGAANGPTTQQAAQKAANKTEAATDEEKEEAKRAFQSNTPQSEPGMGFPRKDGKTVDFFDGETPHTHVRNIAGFIVPLSEKNYNEKTDEQIYKKLVADGYINE